MHFNLLILLEILAGVTMQFKRTIFIKVILFTLRYLREIVIINNLTHFRILGILRHIQLVHMGKWKQLIDFTLLHDFILAIVHISVNYRMIHKCKDMLNRGLKYIQSQLREFMETYVLVYGLLKFKMYSIRLL